MVDPSSPPVLLAISPGRGDLAELLRVLPQLAAGGLHSFLLRELCVSAAERGRIAVAVAGLCRELGLECWIARDVQLARDVGAFGVHLSESCPDPREVKSTSAGELAVGVSVHDPVTRDLDALKVCHHAFLSPVFAGPPKSDAGVLGVERFVEVAASLPPTVYALGGVEGDDAFKALAAWGVRHFAGIRQFFAAEDPRAAVENAILAGTRNDVRATP